MKKLTQRLFSAAAALFAALIPFTAFAEAPAEIAAETDNTAYSEVAEGLVSGGAKGAHYCPVLYNNSSGLPTSEANTVLQTSDGFIWIGSYSGLIRYDGNSFYRYETEGVSSVVSLFEDSKKRLWIGTNDSGAVVMDNGEFRFYDQANGLKTSTVRCITEDNSGNIVIATNLGLAVVDTDGELRILDDSQIITKNITDLKTDQSGTIYGHTKDDMFFTLDDLKISSMYSGSTVGLQDIRCICPVKSDSGMLYLGTTGSEIVKADMRNGMKIVKKLDVSPLVRINTMTDLNGQLWICADNGIGYIGENGVLTKIDNIPMTNSIDDMVSDTEGNLWFASSRQGVMKICESNFVDISYAAGLDEKVVNTTCVYGNDLYIGTDTGLSILSLPDYKQKTTELSQQLARERVRCIKEDSAGRLWLSTYGGLYCMEKDGSFTIFKEGSGFTTNKTRVCEELKDGSMAVSTAAGVYFIRDGKVLGNISADNGLSDRDILSICDGDNGELYLGSDGNGIYILKNNSVTRLSKADGLLSEVILRIKKDDLSGVYWIVTSNSLAYMINDEIHNVKGFPYSNNFDIMFDGSGNMWVLSSNGVYITRTKDLMENEGNLEYIFLGVDSGLPSVATANSRSCMTGSGDIYIAGAAGVSLINVNDMVHGNDGIFLTIPFVEVENSNDGEPELIYLRDKNKITLPASNKKITIYGYGLTYALHNPRMEYCLYGFDTKSASVTRKTLQPVTYTNLYGGNYRFELSVLNPQTGAVDKNVSLIISKELAFYEQLWFKAAVAVAAGLVIFLFFDIIFRKREKDMLKEQEKKQRLIDEMIEVFAKCVDMKDEYTNGHSRRVAEYSEMLAEKLGKSQKECHEIYNMGMLHDIGKISIPDHILNKNGRPTDEEYAILKSHTTRGHEVLEGIKIAPEIAQGAWYHHERPDGKGYPQGLKGDQIPMSAQIIAVADTFDAMYSTRAYRRQMNIQDVLNELKRVSGTQLNGEIVAKLVELVDEGRIGEREL
ncbi:MAG: HD domain-containing protein [Ruminiclostridium sp.]|nr:HD domain-containing protein [Ruminiclostridium sp.]